MRLALVALLLLSAGTARAWTFADWADSAKPDHGKAVAICKAARAIPPPAASAVPEDCDETSLYYGFGQPADPVAARLCAQRHLDSKPDVPAHKERNTHVDIFGTASMLATIYANGAGAPRDLDLAIAYACRINLYDLTEYDVAAIVDELDARRADARRRATPFEICDLPVGGELKATCMFITSAKASLARQARLDALARGLDARSRRALKSLDAAYRAFASARGANERPGGSYAAVIAASQDTDAMGTRVLDLVEAVMKGRIESATPAAAARAEDALRRAFAQAARLPANADVWQRRAKRDVDRDQRKWDKFRKTFVAFAKAAAPATSADGLVVVLIRDRAAQVAAVEREAIVANPLATR